jgi:hypothetical protein
MLNYAELRIQRDVDLLPLFQTQQERLAAAIDSNLLQIPVDDFVTIQTISVVSGTFSEPLDPGKQRVFAERVQLTRRRRGSPSSSPGTGGDQAGGGNVSQQHSCLGRTRTTTAVVVAGTAADVCRACTSWA